MQKLMECPNCHKLYPLVPRHKHLDIAIEHGTVCQHCQHWAHIGYYNPLLIERQNHLTNRRRQRAFKRDFDLFQVEVENHLKESANGIL